MCGLVGKPGLSVYCATKHAVIATVQSGTEAEWDKLQPIGRIGTAEEIGEAVAWLMSPRASLVHGHALVADGGLTVA